MPWPGPDGRTPIPDGKTPGLADGAEGVAAGLGPAAHPARGNANTHNVTTNHAQSLALFMTIASLKCLDVNRNATFPSLILNEKARKKPPAHPSENRGVTFVESTSRKKPQRWLVLERCHLAHLLVR
jgi:hypothetical protein